MARVVPTDALPEQLRPKQESNVVPLDALPPSLRPQVQVTPGQAVPQDALPAELRAPITPEVTEEPLSAKGKVEQAYKRMGPLGRIGFETDEEELAKTRLMGAPTTTGVEPLAVYEKRRQVATETVDRAKAAADQARAEGLPEEEVNRLYNQALGPGVTTVSPAPEEWAKPERFITPAREDKTGAESTLEALQAGTSAFGRGIAKGYYGLAQAGGGELRFFKDMMGMEAGGVEDTLQSIRQKSAAIGESESHPLQLIEGVANSIVQSAPMTASLMSGVNMPAALAGLWVQSFGQTYDESRSLGLSEGESTARGALYGTAEALGERFGLPFTAKFLRDATKGMKLSDATEFVSNLITKEIPGEELTYFLQFGTDKGFGLNPQAGVREYLNGAIDTALVTTMQGGGMYGASKLLNSVARTLNERQRPELEAPTPGNLASADQSGVSVAQESTAPTPIDVAPIVTTKSRDERIAQLQQFGLSEDDAIKIADKELGTEVQDVDRVDTDTTRESTGVPGGPLETGATTGTGEPIRPGMVGAGDVTGAAPSGEAKQPDTLAAEAAPIPQVDEETTIAWSTPGDKLVQTGTGKVVEVEGQKFVEIEAGQAETGDPIYDYIPLEQANVLINPTEEQLAEFTARTETEFDAQQKEEKMPEEVTPTVDPVQSQAKQLANAIYKLDPQHQLIPVLRDEMVNIDDINFAKQELANLQQEAGKPVVVPGETAANAQEVRDVLNQVLAGSKAKDNSVIVDSYDQLPEDLRKQAIAADAKAFRDPRTDIQYYVASAIGKGDIKGTILHERGVHAGLTNLIGEERVTALTNRVTNWAKTGGETVQAKIAQEAVAAANQSGETQGTDRYNQEVIAYFTEIAVNKYGIDPTKNQPLKNQQVKAWLRDLWNAVTEALKKLNVNTNVLTAEDVVNIVYAAARVPTGRLRDEARGVLSADDIAELDRVIADKGFIEKAVDEPIPKIQPSARDLNNKIGTTQPGILKTFIETFYDKIKGSLDKTKLAENPKIAIVRPLVDLGVKEIFPTKPVVMTAGRLLRQLPTRNLYNIINEYRSSVKRAWADPEGTAAQFSNDLTERRERLSKSEQESISVMLKEGDIKEVLQDKYSEYDWYAAVALYKDILSKYTMAGNRLVRMDEKNEVVPTSLKRKEILEHFTQFAEYLAVGMTPKQAFESAYVDTLLAERNNKLREYLNGSTTGWIRFTDPSQAGDLQLITSDTGTAPSPWCIGRDKSYGESYLNEDDFLLYVDDGASVFAALVKKGTNEVNTNKINKGLYGIGDGQSVLPEHQYLKNELTFPEGEASTDEASTDEVATQAQEVLNKAVVGDEQAISEITDAVLTPSFRRTQPQKVVAKVIETIDTNMALDTDVVLIRDQLNTSYNVLSRLTAGVVGAIKAAKEVSFGEVYPQLEELGTNKYNDNVKFVEFKEFMSDLSDNSAENRLIIKVMGIKNTAGPIVRRAIQEYRDKYGDRTPTHDSDLLIESVAEMLGDQIEGLTTDERIGIRSAVRMYIYDQSQPNETKVVVSLDTSISPDYVAAYIVNTDENGEVSGITPIPYEPKQLLSNVARYHDLPWEYDELNHSIAAARKKITDSYAVATSVSVKLGKEEDDANRIQASRRRAPDRSLIKTELARHGTDINTMAPPLKRMAYKLRAIADVAPRITRKIIAYDTSTDFSVDMLMRAGVPHMTEVREAMRNMTIMRGRILAAATDIARRWETYSGANPEASAQLDSMIGYSTLEDIAVDRYPNLATALGNDPILLDLQAKEASETRPRAKAAYKGQVNQRADRIRTAYEMWSNIDQEGKAIYTLVREFYKAMFLLRRSIQDELLNNSNIPGDIKNPATPKGKVMAAINKELDTAGSIDAYFPLGRNGDYWVQFGSGPLKEVYRFESEIKRAEFIRMRTAELQAAGDARSWEQRLEDNDADIGNDINGLRPSMSESSDMLKKAINIIDKNAGKSSAQELKDAIYQLWLETLPERSFRKAYISRKYGGVAGFSADMRREFVKAAYGYANQLSRLRHGPKVVRAIDSAKAAIKGDPKMFNIQPYLDEVEIRMREVLRPEKEDGLVTSAMNGATQLGFLYALSGVSSAMMNITSIPMFGYWTAARYYGTKQASNIMGRYLNVFTHFSALKEKAGGGKELTKLSVGSSSHVRNNPVLAAGFKAIVATEVTETTNTFVLLSMARRPSREYAGAFRKGARIAVQGLGFLFHHSERLMREAQAMAFFELAYADAVKKGMAPGVNGEAFNYAVDMAFNLTKKSMMNYETSNRPRIMRQTGILKQLGPPIFLFKMFPSQVAEFYVTSFMDMFSKMRSKEEKYGAALQFFGSLITGFILGGMSGLWEFEDLLDIIQMVLNRLNKGEKDLTKKDIRLWYRNVLLPELVGPQWAQIIDKGAFSSLTNIDISSRMGINFGFFHDSTPGSSLWEDLQNLAFGIGGPILSLGKRFSDGPRDIVNGYYYEGSEKMVPSLMSNPIAAARWWEEGVKTQYTRKTLIPKEAITAGDVVWKALGFSRTDLDMIRDRNFRLQNIDKRIMNERANLMDRFNLEVERGNTKELRKLGKTIAEFNKVHPNPQYAIELDDLLRSIETRFKDRGMSYQGFPMSKDIYQMFYKALHQVPVKGFREPMAESIGTETTEPEDTTEAEDTTED